MSDLSDFQAELAKRRETLETLAVWHEKMHRETDIDLPYDPAETWISLDVTKRWLPEEQRYEHDLDAERERLRRVYLAAKELGAMFEKEYTRSDFELNLTIPGLFTQRPIELTYQVNREAVCTRRVVGYEDVPERVTPAYRRELVEWDCDTSLIKLAKGE